MMLQSPEPEYLLRVHDHSDNPLVTIECDGTVVIHEKGADKEAAKLFYESLQVEGKKFADLRAHLAKSERKREALVTSVSELVDAMHRYQMDVDEEPPYEHCAMMDRAKKALKENEEVA